TRVDGVHLVVGAHHRAGVPLLDGGVVGRQVDLVEGALVDVGRRGHAVRLLTVGDVVLEGGDDVLSLETPGDGGGALPGEVRVLAEIFEIAPVHRHPVDL